MRETDEPDRSKTGTVVWYDAERGVGAIRPDDEAPDWAVRSPTAGGGELTAGDRVRFQTAEEGGDRTATDIARIRAIQRWENEGGAVTPEIS